MGDRALERRFERFRKRGDVAALGEVFDGAAPELLRVATNVAVGLSAAEDLVQATFLTAIERASSWDRASRLMPWLLGILVRHAHEARRAKAREHGEPSLDAEDRGRAPHERVQAAELSASLHAALRTIPEPYRAVLQPFLVEGRGAAEIALATGRAPGTVRMQIHRGLERLRRALPAGVGLSLALHIDTGRGLAAMRAEVVATASATPAVLAAASAALTGTTWLGGTLWSLTLVKNLSLAVVAVALAAGVAWIAWPAAAPKAPAHVLPVVELALPERAPSAQQPAVARAGAPEAELANAHRVQASASDALANDTLYERSLAGVSGRLLDHRATPVADTEVTLLELGPGMFLRAHEALASGEPPALEIEAQSARTDASGRFRLHGVRTSGFHALGVDLGGPRGTIVFVEQVLNSGEIVELGDVVLAPSGRLVGRVIDEAGRPVAGARVRAAQWPEWIERANLWEWRRDAAFCMPTEAGFAMLELPAWMHAWEPRLPLPTAFTAADGSFTLEAVNVGDVVPLVDRAGRPACLQAPVSVLAEREIETEDLVLAAGRRVAGRVVDAAGTALAGVEVRVGALPGLDGLRHAFGAVMRPAVRTDADGRFAIEGLPGGTPIVAGARRAPELPWRCAVQPDPVQELVLTLATEAELTLDVRASDGAPIANAEVALAADGPFTQRDAPASTSPLRPVSALERPKPGTYVLRGLAPGALHVRVTADGFASATLRPALEPGANVHELRMLAARKLRVRVVSDDSGAPLERCEVSVHEPDTRGPALDGGRTNAAGEVTLARVPAETERDLLVRVEHPGFALTRVPLPADTHELEVRMTRGGSLLALVRDAGHPPAEPVFLEVEGWMVKGVDVLVYGISDAAGRVRVEHLIPGEYSYRVHERFLEQGGFGLVHSFAEHGAPLVDGTFTITEGEVLELAIELGKPGGASSGLECSVSGIVRFDGAPIDGFELMLLPSAGQEIQHEQRSSSGGAYAFEGVAPGRYWLMCVSAGARSESFGGYFQHQVRLELTPGEHRLHDIDLQTRAFQVLTVAEDDARPLAGVTLQLNIQHEANSGSMISAVTDEHGVARLRTSGDGEYRIEAQHPDVGTGLATGTLAAGVEQLTVEVRRGVPCAGVVRIENGADSVSGDATMYLMHSERALQRETRVQIEDDRAEFRVSGLQPGPYQVHLRMSDDVFRPLELELKEAGDEHCELVFEPLKDSTRIRSR